MEQYLSSDVVMSALSPGRHKIQAKRIKGSSSSGTNKKRKSLHILQPSARSQTTLVGVDGVVTTNKKQISGKRKVLNDCNDGRPRKLSRSNDDENESERDNKVTKKNCGKKFAIFEDQSSASDGEKTKTAEEEAYELMVQEPAPDSYWKELAEQRREALEDSLRENEQLHEEVAELKAENTRLKVMADQAEYLAEVVQELMGEEDDKTEDKEEEAKSSEVEDDTKQDSSTKQETKDLTKTDDDSLATKCPSELVSEKEDESETQKLSSDDNTTEDESDSENGDNLS